MNELEGMTEEQLMAVLGEDPALLAELLRSKGGAEDRANASYEGKQDGYGKTVFDPLGVVANVVNRRRAGKEAAEIGTKVDEELASRKEGKATYAKLHADAVAPAPVPMVTMDPNAGPARMPQTPVAPPSAPTTMFNPNAAKPPAMGAAPAGAPPAPAPGLGAMPAGEPLRGPPKPGSARPPLANASTMSPDALVGAGVPPEVLIELLRKRSR